MTAEEQNDQKPDEASGPGAGSAATTPASTADKAAPTTTENAKGTDELTRGRPAVWALFFALVVAVLAVDLGLKAWAFENVSDYPIKLRTAEAGGPEVLYQHPVSNEWVVVPSAPGQPPVVPNREEEVVVVPQLLHYKLTLNTGAVFGTGKGGRPFFISVSIVAAIVILVLVYRSPANARFYQAALALIFGGALGNLYDRVMFSAVRDMLYMLPGTGLWPWIFNPADVALVCGVGVVLVASFLADRKRAQLEKQAKAAA